MKSNFQTSICIQKFFLVLLLFAITNVLKAESIETWYANAQKRIDTLRKGTFGIKIIDKNGQPFSGKYSVRMTKHEFPFGIAFDLNEGAVANGNSYTSSATVSAKTDAEIYQTERWFSFIAYAIPVVKNTSYKVTLKLAEVYFDKKDARVFNAIVEGNKFLSNYDVFAEAGGKNIAKDTSITITTSDSIINIEFVSLIDNAAIKGIEIEKIDDGSITRINCGGGALTTKDGHVYKSDVDYFDLSASRLPTEEQWAKAAMQKYFNYGVSGNSFKWSGIQPQHTTPNYTAFDNAVKWTQSIGWELRAHTLLWGGYEYTSDHELPRWVKDLPTPQAITDTCKMRVVREVSHYKGIIKEYDVINEPLHAKYLSSVVGDSINWNCFKWARSADPDAKLFINDYNVEYNWGDAKKYRDMILDIKSKGAPVTGVGMQAHFWQNMRPQLNELVSNINIVAEAGLPIKLTEFDNGDMSQEAQASDFIMVNTIAFSHPSINGIINWALSDKGAWRTNSGLFEANHKPKLAADTLLYLTKKLWSTNFDTITNGGANMFKGYYGNYTVEVDFNGVTKVFTIPCIKTNSDSIFVLNEMNALVKGPEFVSAQLISNNSLKIEFTKPIQGNSITKGDFKFFTNNPLRIQEINIDPENSKKVIITLQNDITPNDFLAASYFPGSLSSTDGGKANAFGPETVKNLTTGLISASVTNDGNNIEATFNETISNVAENLSSFTISIDGKQVVASSLKSKETDSKVIVFNLPAPVAKTSKVTIKYTKGTLKPSFGYDCQSSADIAVSNLWPAIVKAEVTTKGNQVTALFGTMLKDIIANKDAFTLLVDGQKIEISSIAESGKDSSLVTFTTTETIVKSGKVTLSYAPGTIKALNGNSLTAIDKTVVTNNSAATAVEQINLDEIKVYPNPASDFISISSNMGIKKVSIYNSLGLLVYNGNVNASELKVNVASFYSGVYVLQMTDNKEVTSFSKFVKK